MAKRDYNYLLILTFIVINLFGLVLFLPRSESILFIKEFYFLLLVLMFVAIGLFSVARGVTMGWLLFAVFFAINMFNEFYLYNSYEANIWLFIGLISIGIIGFVFSLSNLIKNTEAIKRSRKSRVKRQNIKPKFSRPKKVKIGPEKNSRTKTKNNGLKGKKRLKRSDRQTKTKK